METLPILTAFGCLFTLVLLLAIFVPYVRRRADLVSVRNLFLLGAINFVSLASVKSGLMSRPVGQYSTEDCLRFVAGAIVFFTFFLLSYHHWGYPARAASRRWLRWGPMNTTPLVLIVFICTVLGGVALMPTNIPGLSVIFLNFCSNAPLIGLVFAFVSWYRDRYNPFLVAILCFTVLVCLIPVFAGGSTRRPLLGLLMAFPIVMYWMKLRYRSVASTLTTLGVMIAIAFVLVSAYSGIRHSTRAGGTSAMSFERVIERVTAMKTLIVEMYGAERALDDMTTDCSLAAIKHYPDWSDSRPFYTFWFVATNPIPRAVWPDKPEALGTMLPRELGKWRTGYINWGPGIVGHGYHEGGLIMLVIYGLIFGGCASFLDHVLVRQSDNPYLLGIFAALSPEIIAFSRGDIGYFLMLNIGAIVTGRTISWIARKVFGGGIEYPRGDVVVDQYGYGHFEGQLPEHAMATYPPYHSDQANYR